MWPFKLPDVEKVEEIQATTSEILFQIPRLSVLPLPVIRNSVIPLSVIPPASPEELDSVRAAGTF